MGIARKGISLEGSIMTEFEYFPTQRIVVHDFMEYDLDEFIDLYVAHDANIRWIEGVLFAFSGFEKTPEIINSEINGTYHFRSFSFVRVPTYPKSLTRKDSLVSVGVIENSKNKGMVDLIRWLKTLPIWKEKEKPVGTISHENTFNIEK